MENRYKARSAQDNSEVVGRLTCNSSGDMCLFVDCQMSTIGEKWGYTPIFKYTLKISTGLFDYNGKEVFDGDYFTPYYDPSFNDSRVLDDENGGKVIFENGCFSLTHKCGGNSIPLFNFLDKEGGNYIPNYGNKIEYSCRLLGEIKKYGQ